VVALATKALATGVVVVLVVFAFATVGAPQPSASARTITVGFTPDITSADPQVSNELPPLYLFAEGLTSKDPTGKVVPFLAQSWTVSNDGRTYTFRLRPNVLFHNGRALTAEDVKFSLERVKNPATAAFRQADMRLVQSITVIDPHTVQITLDKPNAGFPAILVGVFIIAPESVGNDGKVMKPIATGPFQFSEWAPGDRLIVQRFPRYWQPGLPKVDTVVVRMISDPTARVNGVRAGDLDLITDVEPALVPLLARDPALHVESAKTTIYGHVTFNMKNPQGPLADVRVRRAIAYALDKTQLVRARESSSAVVNDQMYRPGEFWHVPLPDAFATRDVAKAQALLRDAGAGSFSTELITLQTYERVALVIQQQLRPIGIDVKVTSLPDFASFQARLMKYDYGFLSDTGYPRDDPSQLFGFWETGSPSGIYRGGFSDPALDQMLVTARTASDPDARKQALRAALDFIEYQKVATVIYSGQGEVWAYRTRLRGFYMGDTQRFHYSGAGLAYTSVTP